MNYYPYYYRGVNPPYQPDPRQPFCSCQQCMPVTRTQPPGYFPHPTDNTRLRLSDQGKKPFVIDIEEAAERNTTFRTAIWTGENLQVTLMSINPGEDVGLEVHPKLDQFLRIEEGYGVAQMGDSQENLDFVRNVEEDDAIIVPAGTWHNLTNTGNEPLKLYSIYAPPEHAYGTVHQTQEDDK